MYFTKIRLNGLSVVDLPIVGALPSDQFILKSADGLGPPEVDVSIADTLHAGGIYQGRRPHSRELVFHIGLNPNYGINQSVSDLRTTLYGMLTPGYIDNVTVSIMNDTAIVAKTTSYVKKLEINPFSKDPEVQLTMSCLQQYFEALSPLYLTIPSKVAPAIDNIGTAPAGFHMEVIFTANHSVWTLSDASGKKMQITYTFITGDKLVIDTRPGHRGIWVVRGGTTTNIIYALSTDSIWYMLHGGNNVFITSSQAFNWDDVYYLPQYWGI